MKSLLILLLLASSAFAQTAALQALKDRSSMTPEQRRDEWNARVRDNKAGAGLRPKCDAGELPGYIQTHIRNRAKNPETLEFVRWTQPKLTIQVASGEKIGHWSLQVLVRSTNSYGATVPQALLVIVEREVVTQLRDLPMGGSEFRP